MKCINPNRDKPLTNKEFDIVVIGEINVDLILKGDVEPVFGQVEKIVKYCDLSIGSSAVIFACGASRLGLKTAFIGIAGDDTFGRFMVSEMKARGIDTSGVILKPGLATGVSVILSKNSDRAILTYLGAIPEFNLSDVDFSIISRSKHLHLASYFLLDGLLPDISALFQKAHELGLTISLDTNYDPNEQWNSGLHNLLGHVDILLPNQTEITAIAKEEDLSKAMRAILKLGPSVVVKLGKDGAIFQPQGGEAIRQESIKVDVVDTVRAGDSFDAGFIYGYLNEMDWQRSLKLATICGSLSTRKFGGTSSQPTLEEALSYL